MLQEQMQHFLLPDLQDQMAGENVPVGTVFIGCTLKGKTVVQEHHFQGDRSSIREQAVAICPVLLRECIHGKFSTKKTENNLYPISFII